VSALTHCSLIMLLGDTPPGCAGVAEWASRRDGRTYQNRRRDTPGGFDRRVTGKVVHTPPHGAELRE